MNDLIPAKYKATIGIIVTILVACLAVVIEWQDLGAEWVRWTSRAFALTTVISNVLGLPIVAPKLPPAVPK
jgi:hypothetical protein